jgi:hypothetical protein
MFLTLKPKKLTTKNLTARFIPTSIAATLAYWLQTTNANAATMADFLAPWLELRASLVVFLVILAIAAVAGALMIIPRSPGLGVGIIVVIIVAFIVGTAILAS